MQRPSLALGFRLTDEEEVEGGMDILWSVLKKRRYSFN
ncbi:hypothetical protein HAT2_00704 [Candidatus Similichlamydia laticola]|uniref:Uncharacterized protein n=1 Tax=Candidatus Similichlamydia laticola TaxID=2170265 RepID=A0A369KHI3_9BACT|nr:hypothetical protein HAT2_00704 [Candidatus Similichlamydia laticola]